MTSANLGETLISLARAHLEGRDELIRFVPPGVTMSKIQFIVLALKFYRSPPALQFRAMFENWNIYRIKSEVY